MTALAEPLLLTDRDARGVVTLTLNRPAAFNALSEALLDALQRSINLPPTIRFGSWCWPVPARLFVPGMT